MTERPTALRVLGEIQRDVLGNEYRRALRAVQLSTDASLKSTYLKENYAAALHGLFFKRAYEHSEAARQAGEMFNRAYGFKTPSFESLFSKYGTLIPETQSLSDYDLLSRLKADFDDLIRSKFTGSDKYHVSDRVFFGTLDTPQVGALILPVPDDQYLILINRGLWEGLVAFSQSVCGCITIGDSGLAIDTTRVPRYTTLFTRFMVNVLWQRDPYTNSAEIMARMPDGYTLTKEQQVLWSHLDTFLDAFIFGHEYAHFLHDHFNTHGGNRTVIIEQKERKTVVAEWWKEYEADTTASDLVVFLTKKYNDDNDIPFLFCLGIVSAELALLILDEIERRKRVIFTADSSHPPTSLRLARLRRRIYGQMTSPGARGFFKTQFENTFLKSFIAFTSNYSEPMPVSVSDPQTFEERQFQDTIFESVLLSEGHKNMIGYMKEISINLTKNAGNIEKIKAVVGNGNTKMWLAILYRRMEQAKFGWAFYRHCFDNCIGVLEKSLENWNPREQ